MTLPALTPLAPDRVRAEAVRLRCRSALVRQATRARRTGGFATSFGRLLVPVLLGTVSAIYTAALVNATLRIEGWLR